MTATYQERERRLSGGVMISLELGWRRGWNLNPRRHPCAIHRTPESGYMDPVTRRIAISWLSQPLWGGRTGRIFELCERPCVLEPGLSTFGIHRQFAQLAAYLRHPCLSCHSAFFPESLQCPDSEAEIEPKVIC